MRLASALAFRQRRSSGQNTADAPAERLKFGKCSVFDAVVEDAESLPFDVPIKRFLEDALMGMNGSAQDQSPGAKAEGCWRRLCNALHGNWAVGACESLLWLSLGCFFGTVRPRATDQLRRQLASYWLKGNMEIREKARSENQRDWLLNTIPVVFAQAIYRIMVDAFLTERDSICKECEVMVGKLLRLVHLEVLRERLFQSQVLQFPYMESKRKMMRMERFDHPTGGVGPNPLAFGTKSAELDELQLMQMEHIMELRREADLCSPTSISAPAEVSRTSGFSRSVGQHARKSLVPPELCVDRYDHVASTGRLLLARQLKELEDLEKAAATQEMGDPTTFLHLDERVWSPAAHDSPSRGRFLQSTGTFHLSATQIRLRREDEASERRRRLEQLSTALSPSLGQEALNTHMVSPLMLLIAPGCDKQQAPSAQRLKLDAAEEDRLPRLSPQLSQVADSNQVKSQPRLEPSKKASKPQKLPLLFSGEAQALRMSSKAFPSESPKGGVLSLDPPERLGNQVVINRLKAQVASFKENSFDKYRLEFDLASGAKRHRMDAAGLRSEEARIIGKHQSLLGSRSTPAMRLLR